ncbi:MAG: YjgN family protein [Noviherbaspirillum sp.]
MTTTSHPPAAPAVIVEHLRFTGSGSEYFRIWITNTFLSIITLGIYSAWAKVRRTHYFYANTRLSGAGFEYHGRPVAILKGRIVALVLLVGYQVASESTEMLAAVLFAAVLAAMPWLIWKSFQFRLYNSSYRGLRFGFAGSAAGAYVAYLLWPALASITGLLLAPFAHQRIKRYQHTGSRYGAVPFELHAGVGSFYLTYLKALLVLLAGIAVLGLVFGSAMAAIARLGRVDPSVYGSVLAFMVALYAWFFLIIPLFSALMQNLVWNRTSIGPHRFESRVSVGRVLFIALSNLFGIVCTLGLYTPFATIRMMKYRIEAVALLADGSLDDFVAIAQAEAGATGEGVADLLDLDLAL